MINCYENKNKTWDEFLQFLEEKLSGAVAPWLAYLEPVGDIAQKSENDIFLIKSSKSFAIRVLEEKHLKEIENALEEFSGIKRAVRFIYDENVKKKKPKKQTTEQKNHIETAQRMENLAQMHSWTGLDLKYTFENFVEGENSRLAYRVSQMIAENPGQNKYNPLFLSGSVGLGKTHLMQAIGHKILRNFPSLKIRYTKAEEFGNKLTEAFMKPNGKGYVDINEKMKKFRDMYRNVDVLLIDDIQYIDGKKRTIEEVFNTFEALYQAGKQIVFASDRPLSAFEEIPDRIKSRFKWGIEAEIKVPDLMTRKEIVKRHAIASNFPITDEVAEFLALHFSTNVRELEGAYNKASTIASIEGVELDINNTREFLEIDENKKKITVDDIIQKCANYFNVNKEDILSTARAKEIVNARKYAIFLTREMLDLSFPSMGREFKKNSTTMMYQYDRLKKEVETNRAMSLVVEELKEMMNI